MLNPIRKVSLNILKEKSPDQSSDWPPDALSLLQFNKDKHRYNNVLVVIDCLLKESISIPCYKTTIAKEIALLFIYHV